MNESNRWIRAYALYSGAGLQLVIAIGGMSWVGMWCDERYGWTPWGAFAGVILGSIAGFYNLIRIVNKASADADAAGE